MRYSFIVIPFILLAFLTGFLLLNKESELVNFEYVSEGDIVLTTSVVKAIQNVISGDIENQLPLENKPQVVKAIYATSWTAGSSKGIDRLIKFIKETEINAIVVDIKDYAGIISYDIQVPEVIEYSAKEIRIPKINSLIKRLHDENIYVIGRLTVFQDPILATKRPDLSVKDKNTGEPWKDRKGISWVDTSSVEVWDYNISIARDAFDRGFDEINFDYIRFPSDGDLSLMKFSHFNPETEYKKDAVRKFYQYLRKELEGKIISGDLFGYTAINVDDLGIGQIIEYAYESFDYVSPMIYPSHFNKNFLGYPNPSYQPYEVIKYSMESAIKKLIAYNKSVSVDADGKPVANINYSKLRPWLQDFDLWGVEYDAEKVKVQINAVEEGFTSGCNTILETGERESCNAHVEGWMLWNARNVYTKEALKAN